MRQDIVFLEKFYATRLGQAAQLLMFERVADLWPDCEGLSVLGMGYGIPLLSGFAATARTCVAAVPEGVGQVRWKPTDRGIASVMTEEDHLPFADGSFDRIILLHGVEEAESPRAVLREAWRLLSPEGRILIAVANRKGLWSLAEGTPFGHGRPWTRRQLIRYLTDHLFQVTASTSAVHVPPVNFSLFTAGAHAWERAGELITPGLGGVVLVEAIKHQYVKPGGSATAPTADALPGRKGVATLPRNKA